MPHKPSLTPQTPRPPSHPPSGTGHIIQLYPSIHTCLPARETHSILPAYTHTLTPTMLSFTSLTVLKPCPQNITDATITATLSNAHLPDLQARYRWRPGRPLLGSTRRWSKRRNLAASGKLGGGGVEGGYLVGVAGCPFRWVLNKR